MMEKRYAAIGLNKSGTRSLSEVFRQISIRPLHSYERFSLTANKMMNSGKKIFGQNRLAKYFFVSDLWFPHAMDFKKDWHKQLATQEFRSAVCNQLVKEKVRLIINVREIRSWFESRKKHLRMREKKYNSWIGEQWLKEYHEHYGFLKEFSKSRDCLYLDICGGDSISKLFDWIGIESKIKSFPHIGKSI